VCARVHYGVQAVSHTPPAYHNTNTCGGSTRIFFLFFFHNIILYVIYIVFCRPKTIALSRRAFPVSTTTIIILLFYTRTHTLIYAHIYIIQLGTLNIHYIIYIFQEFAVDVFFVYEYSRVQYIYIYTHNIRLLYYFLYLRVRRELQRIVYLYIAYKLCTCTHTHNIYSI